MLIFNVMVGGRGFISDFNFKWGVIYIIFIRRGKTKKIRVGVVDGGFIGFSFVVVGSAGWYNIVFIEVGYMYRFRNFIFGCMFKRNEGENF